MPTLLAVGVSPRHEYSTSRKLTALFVENWKAAHPGGKVIERDLMKTDLPFADMAWIGGAFTPPEQHSPESGAAIKISNELIAAVLDQDPAVHGGRRVVFLASDGDGAADEIGALAEKLGFAPIKLGGLSEGGLLIQARGDSWGRLIFKDLVKFGG